MWDEKLFELFLTIIPQSFALMLLFFSLSDIKVEKWSFIIFSTSFSLIPFFIRPYVNFGIHSLISIFALVLIAVLWANENMIKSVLNAIITFGAAFLAELVIILFLGIMKFDTSVLETDARVRTIAGVFPIIILFATGFTVRFVKKKAGKKEDKDDTF